MPGVCSNPDCTIAVTGKCLLLHADPQSCPNYGKEPLPVEPSLSLPESGTPSSVENRSGRQFHPGNELGTEDAEELMRARYTTLIGILGQYDVGKTCFLSSLYLLASCGGLGADLAFSGSLTLSGFEARARRLRRWKDGALPQQLADHTVLASPRVPALMHLALREISEQRRRFDLLLTDLPGEWSKDLVNTSDTVTQFRFLERADGLIFVLSGPKFASSERHVEVENANLLISRVRETLHINRDIPLVLMVSKADELSPQIPPAVEKVVQHARKLGFSPKVIPVAAISRTPKKVKSGTGVMEVIEHMLDRHGKSTVLKIIEPAPSGTRAIEHLRG